MAQQHNYYYYTTTTITQSPWQSIRASAVFFEDPCMVRYTRGGLCVFVGVGGVLFV